MSILESAYRAAKKEKEEENKRKLAKIDKKTTVGEEKSTTSKPSILESAYRAAGKQAPTSYTNRTTPTRSSPESITADDERSVRIGEIKSELSGLSKANAGWLRGGVTGEVEKNNKKIAELEAELEELESQNSVHHSASGREIANNAFWSGLGTFNRGIASTLDFILPTEFLGKYDFISNMNEYYAGLDDYYKQKKSDSLQNANKTTKVLADIGEGAVAALPNAIMALMTAGTSAAATAGTTLGTTSANTGILTTVANTAKSTVKNPMYWSSMAQTLGTDYEEAKANGANEFVASASAILKSAINAGIEVGGGIETLPTNIKSGDTKAITAWVMSMVDEGKEEVVQGIVSNSVDKLMYDYNKDLVSLTDESAVINPQRMAKEFGMGTAVGGVLGGAQTGVISLANKAVKAYSNAETVQRQNEIADFIVNDDDTLTALIEEGKASGEDTTSAKIAQEVEVAKKNGTVTREQVKELIVANEEQIRTEVTIDDAPATLEEAARGVVESRNAVQTGEMTTDEIVNRLKEALSEETTLKENDVVSQEGNSTAEMQRLHDILENVAREKLSADKTEHPMNDVPRKSFGKSDILLTEENAQKTPLEIAQAKANEAAFKAGRENVPRDRVILDTPEQEKAYNDGRLEHIKNMTSDNSSQNNIENSSRIEYNENKSAEKKVVRTKKSDWASADVEWHIPNRKTPIAYSTKASSDLIEVLADENPSATISELKDLITYDAEAKKVLQQYIDAGYGKQNANEWFSYNRKHGYSNNALAQHEAREKKMREVMSRFGLTEDEAYSVNEYKSSEAYKINAKLREDESLLDETQKELVKHIDSALEKLPKHTGKSYRTISFDDVFNPEEEYNAFLEQHSEGNIIKYNSYTSASAIVDGHPMPDDTKYGITLEIDGENGRDVDGFGNNFEKEVVFPRGLRFDVTEVSTDSKGRPYIKVKEITKNGRVQIHPEERGNILQQVQIEKAIHGDLYEIPGLDTGRSVDTENSVQGVRTDKERLNDVHNAISDGESSSAQDKIANDVIKYIEKGKDFTSARLFEIADKAYGGTMAEGKYTVKDAYDGMELAVNRYLMSADFVKKANGDTKTAVKTIDKLIDLLTHIPTQTKRTAEMESYQQFSTPPNIAYLAAWVANINSSDVVLEPSAGIGGLALWGKAWGATVYANELSKRRLAFLDELDLDGTFNLNAEQIDNLLPDNIKPSVIVMNPPFSATAGRMSKNDTSNAKRHIEQALERLEPNGRLVAILGNGMADDAPAFKSWWEDLRSKVSIRANVRIDGSNYRKYGTTFDVQLVVIDKAGPNTEQTITGTYKDLTEIPNLLEGIRNDKQTVVRDSNAGIERDTTARNDKQRDSGFEHSDGITSNVLGGQRKSENGLRTPDRKGTSQSDRTRNNRAEGDSSIVRSDAESKNTSRAKQSDKGPRMVLSRSTDTDVDGKSNVNEVDENSDSVYATYVPRKVHIKGAKKHPARLVESAAMAAVDPPDVTYTPSLPESIATSGILSDAQLENVVYAGQAHNQTLGDGRRKGYFIGDGTGVGKGRQISGIIMDNFLQGRKKAVWISASTGLVNDAKRDWKDLGGNPDDIIDLKGTKLLKTGIQADSGILFGAYSTLSNSANKEQRFNLLKNWLGEDFDGIIALDEAHKMGNSVPMKKSRGKSKPSQQALTGIELQKMFPNARIVYASATGATDISQYGYLERLGLWGKGTAFNDLNDFIEKISSGGLAAMELVARDMKAMGVYMARSISYDDVKYDTLQHDLSPMQTEIYNTMSEAWQKVLQNVTEALEVTGGNKNGQAKGAAYSAIFSGQQRFYNQILTSMSMPSVIEDMKKELAAGRSCVIQLTNTNEAQANRAIAKNEAEGGNLEDLDLTPSETLTQLLEKSFPIQVFEEYMDEEGRVKSRLVRDADGNPVIDKKAVRMRDSLIAELQQMKVPDGPLEMLLDAFGVDEVAEVTGRSRRVVEKRDESGKMRRVIETRSATAGTADAKMFQDGKKRILVFSDAGGTGFSYHADKRAKNQQQRVHYLLQPGWSASNAVQGFGRTHRSNQASAPIVRLITTNAMGQKRFTSTIARRLDQLGALTKGQRQTGSGVFSEKDNLENPIASDALSQYYKSADRNMLKKLGLYDSLFDEYGRINESSDDLRNISKFLNRILSLKVVEQNEVFREFYDTFERMMDVAISNGTVDMGLENYRADKIEVIDEMIVRKDDTGADTKYVQMKTYKKPEITPYSKLDTSAVNFKGLVRMEDGGVRAVFETSSKTNARGEIERRFRLESPVKGVSNTFVEKTLKEKTTVVDKSEWKQAWKEEIDKAPEYTEGTLHLLTGTLLPIWNRLPQNNTRVMRVLSSDGRQYLGRVIAPSQIDFVLKGLGAGRTMQTYTPQQISDAVLIHGKEVALRDNRQKLTRRRVSNDWRMEITGQNIWYLQKQYPDLISERINYEYRYFIPTGEAGTKVLEDIIKNNPVVDVRTETKTGDVDMFKEDENTDKLAMWTTKRVGDEIKPKSISEIVAYIEHEFGINITTGHIRGKGVQGTFSPDNHGIRTKIANDLPDLSHELGHYFERTLDITSQLNDELRQELISNLDETITDNYPEGKLVREGVAEYVRKFFQNRETAAIDYKKFNKFFLSCFTPKDLAKVTQLADDINAYYSLDADTATSSIRLREEGAIDLRSPIEKMQDWSSSMYQAWVDANDSIRRFDRATGSNAYMFASNAAYSDAIAGQIITGDLTDFNGKYVAPGLKTVFHGINLNDKEEYKLFGEYLTVKHGPERLREGMRVLADDRKNNTSFFERRQAEIEAQCPQFKEASERLYAFIKQFYKTWGVGTGLISEETLNAWSERWEYYVPFNRVMENGQGNFGTKKGFANQNSTIKKSHGSGKDIQQPIDNLMNNIVLMVNAGIRNNVMRVIADSAERLGADATFLEKVPMPLSATRMDMTGVKDKLTTMLEESDLDAESKEKASGIVNNLEDILTQYGRGKAKGNVVTVLIDGKPQAWKINDVGLLESLTSLSPKTMDGILDAYAITSRIMTSNITGANLIWSIFSNSPVDTATFFTYSKNKNVFKMAKGVGEAYLNKAKGDEANPLYKEFLAMGGGKTSAYTADRNLTKKMREKLAGKLDLNPFDWIGYVSDMIESGPRFATYKLMREKGMTPHEAFYEAMDITVNFRRGGRISREINKIVPFFNAGVQGLDKFRRWITADEVRGPDRKKAIASRTISYITASAVLAALSYILNNSDDEKEKEYEQLSSYTKNTYWVIPIGNGKYFALPKPREIAVLSSFFETCLEYSVGENKHAFDEFFSYASENFLPAIANDIVQAPTKGLVETGANIIGSLGIIGVIGYLSANRDFLGRPIVASGLQNLEKKDQYTDRTSKIAYWLGQAFGGSPEQIDYFFQQVLGGYWKGLKALFPVGEKNRDWTLGVANTYIKDNQYSTDLTNWLYERADMTARAKTSAPNDIDKAIAAKWDSNMTRFYGTYYKIAKSNSNSTMARSTRQTVLDMIREYQKGIDGNYKTTWQKAVEAVCERKNSTEYLPAVMPSEVIDGKQNKHVLSDIQYVEYQTDYLRIYWETVEDTLHNSMTTTEKARMLIAAKRVAKEQATERTLKRIYAPSSEFASKYKGIKNDDLTEYLAGVDAANDDDSVNKAEVLDVIRNMNIDDDDAWTLLLSRYDSTGAKYAQSNGIGGNSYIDFLDALDEVDKPTESGKYGTYTQDEAYEAIKNLTGLSRKDKAVLWQSVNKNWKAENNPFN